MEHTASQKSNPVESPVKEEVWRTAIGDWKGKFAAGVETEIAEVREKMSRSRKEGMAGAEDVQDRLRSKLVAKLGAKGENNSSTSIGSSGGSYRNAAGEGRGETGGNDAPQTLSRMFVIAPKPAANTTPDEDRRVLRGLVQRVKWATAGTPLRGEPDRQKLDRELDEAYAAFADVSGQCRALSRALVGFEVRRRTELHEKMRRAEGAGLEDEALPHEDLARALEKAPNLMEVREWKETVGTLMTRLSERMQRAATVEPVDETAAEEGTSTAVGQDYDESYTRQPLLVTEELSYLTELLQTFRDSELVPGPIRRRVDSLEKAGTVARKIWSAGGGGVRTFDFQGAEVMSHDFDFTKEGDTLARDPGIPRGNGIKTHDLGFAKGGGPMAHDLDPIKGDETTAREADTHGSRETMRHEFVISKRGDTSLVFPILSKSACDDTCESAFPGLREAVFRVSSHILSETSPVFAHLFSGAPPPSRSLDDGLRKLLQLGYASTQIRTHIMTPLLPREIRPLEILLHASHMHNDKIPRDIGFEDFVTVAELCLRFQCTSPLELFVEMCWLQDWMHKGIEPMPDGLLIISYTFGCRGLFTRMSKSAILNIVDEAELEAKTWPAELKAKIWAVRSAKMEQIYACFVSTVQEYLRPPREPVVGGVDVAARGRPMSILEAVAEMKPAETQTTASLFPQLSSTLFLTAAAPATPQARPFPTSTPRCPKGSHECDAANLGFFMMVLAELQLLPIVMNPGALAHTAGAGLPARSLAGLVAILQELPSPQNSIHRGGVCNPMPAFRHAVVDIYNSLSGLTLFDVTGKHGYALSRAHAGRPQITLQTTAPGGPAAAAAAGGTGEVPEGVALGIMRELGSIRDVRAAAMTSRGFYETYKRHEVALTARVGATAPGGKEWGAGCASVSSSFEVLTEEEARKIIWPDSPVPEYAPRAEQQQPPPPPLDLDDGPVPEGSREKFRAEDALFVEGKVLSVVETKQLRVEHDVYLGMHRDKVEGVGGMPGDRVEEVEAL